MAERRMKRKAAHFPERLIELSLRPVARALMIADVPAIKFLAIYGLKASLSERVARNGDAASKLPSHWRLAM